jgi:hypothetical protein
MAVVHFMSKHVGCVVRKLQEARGPQGCESQKVSESLFLNPLLLLFALQFLVQCLQMFFEHPAHYNRNTSSCDAYTIGISISRTPFRRPNVPATGIINEIPVTLIGEMHSRPCNVAELRKSIDDRQSYCTLGRWSRK